MAYLWHIHGAGVVMAGFPASAEKLRWIVLGVLPCAGMYGSLVRTGMGMGLCFTRSIRWQKVCYYRVSFAFAESIVIIVEET